MTIYLWACLVWFGLAAVFSLLVMATGDVERDRWVRLLRALILLGEAAMCTVAALLLFGGAR